MSCSCRDSLKNLIPPHYVRSKEIFQNFEGLSDECKDKLPFREYWDLKRDKQKENQDFSFNILEKCKII